jgi:predicted DCC family thiol-disulfide oxidoreductase YuxK
VRVAAGPGTLTPEAEAMQTDYLLYDGECPACRAYVAMSRLRQLYPDLRVIDARFAPALVAELRRGGYEINDGMVLSLDGHIHFGPEATRMISALGQASPSRWRRASLAFFGEAPWSRALYPWLNRGRQLLLRLLGRKLIG